MVAFRDLPRLHSRDPRCNTFAGCPCDHHRTLKSHGARTMSVSTPQRVGVGLIGSQFITSIHAEALRACNQADIRAVASPTPGNAMAFAQRHGIPRHFTDYRELLNLPDVDMVVVGVPNDLHCPIALDAAPPGKHFAMDKPLS